MKTETEMSLEAKLIASLKSAEKHLKEANATSKESQAKWRRANRSVERLEERLSHAKAEEEDKRVERDDDAESCSFYEGEVQALRLLVPRPKKHRSPAERARTIGSPSRLPTGKSAKK